MRRILLVDDDPRLLEGLEGLFFDRMDEWEIETAESGAQALEELETSPFDLMITDMRMPQMDGTQLLEQVKDKFPDMLFFVLSGHAREEDLLRAMTLAHRYLAKPCTAHELFDAIESGFKLLDTLERGQFSAYPDLFSRIGGALDGVKDLLALLDDERTTYRDLAEVIAGNVFMATRVIQIANSALYGGARTCRRLETAIARIGFPVLKSILVEFQLKRAFSELDVASFQVVQKELRLVALAARTIASELRQPGDYFLQGLLQGVGMFAVAFELGDVYIDRCRRFTRLERLLFEQQTFGFSNHVISAHVLRLWGFDANVADMIERLGEPGEEARGIEDARLILEASFALLDHAQGEREGARHGWNEENIIATVGRPQWDRWAAEIDALVAQEDV